MQTQSSAAESRPTVNTESSDESHSSTQLSLEEFALALQDDLALLDAEGFGVLKDCMDDFLKLMNACANKAVLGQLRAFRCHPADDDALIAVPGEWVDDWSAAAEIVDQRISELDVLFGAIVQAFAACMRLARAGRSPDYVAEAA